MASVSVAHEVGVFARLIRAEEVATARAVEKAGDTFRLVIEPP